AAGAGRGVAVGGSADLDPVVRQGHGGGGGAVVDLVHPGCRDREGPLRDVRRGRGRGVEGVVARIGAGDRDPGDRDGLAVAHVLVPEAGRGVAVGEHVTGHPVVRQGHGGGGRAVVDLVHPGCRDREGPLRDVGRGRG